MLFWIIKSRIKINLNKNIIFLYLFIASKLKERWKDKKRKQWMPKKKNQFKYSRKTNISEI